MGEAVWALSVLKGQRRVCLDAQIDRELDAEYDDDMREDLSSRRRSLERDWREREDRGAEARRVLSMSLNRGISERLPEY